VADVGAGGTPVDISERQIWCWGEEPACLLLELRSAVGQEAELAAGNGQALGQGFADPVQR